MDNIWRNHYCDFERREFTAQYVCCDFRIEFRVYWYRPDVAETDQVGTSMPILIHGTEMIKVIKSNMRIIYNGWAAFKASSFGADITYPDLKSASNLP